MPRWLPCWTFALLAACSRSSDSPPVVRLVDVFDGASLEGSPGVSETPPRTEWRFHEDALGWDALTGVAGLGEKTVVAFISDHGEEFLDHGMHFNGNNGEKEDGANRFYLTRVPSP